jgi:putative addiction module component (TIGR02574 family)
MSESDNKAVNAIYEAALKLSAEERELLVVMLEQHDAPRWASPEIEAAWMEEIERREQLFREGKMEAYAWEEVRERILKRLAALR